MQIERNKELEIFKPRGYPLSFEEVFCSSASNWFTSQKRKLARGKSHNKEKTKMLLRSSSTPVLGSLLSSFSETPNHHHNSDPFAKHPLAAAHPKLSFHHHGSLNYTQFSINSSPVSPAISDLSVGATNAFRRAQSEGNLEGLIASDPCKSDDEFSNIPKPPKKRPNWSHLETIPSFHYFNGNGYEDDIDSEEEEESSEGEEFEETDGGCFENSMEGEEKYMGVRSRALNVEKERMGLDEEINLLLKEGSGTEMYLARGLGVDSISIGFGGGGHKNNGSGGGGGGGSRGGGDDGGGGGEGNQPGVEDHYKRLVEENPSNPLFLRNYAQFLYESKGDLRRAEEYYSRAILADPKDGAVLSQYAKLVWELHHDQDRALSYFERAVHAAPADSYVHAAYASFLWETEEDEDGDDTCALPQHCQNGAMASATA